MPQIDSLKFTFQFNPWLLVLIIPLLGLYSWYIYRFTIPQVGRLKKTILFLLRALGISALILMVFEPVLTIGIKKTLLPKHYIFIDQSKSMSIKEPGFDKPAEVKLLLSAIKDNRENLNFEFYSFGANVLRTHPDSVSFNEALTNFSLPSVMLKKFENPVSATFISDGIQTEGVHPAGELEKAAIPVFAFAIGDTAKKKDLFIGEILANEYLYNGVKSEIKVFVINNGYGAIESELEFLDEDKRIELRKITLQEGSNLFRFNYTPTGYGEKRIRFAITPLDDEKNKKNNSKNAFIKVRESKLKITLVGGAPSADFSFISNSLSADTNIVLYSIVELGNGKFSSPIDKKRLDSTAVLFLVNFPSQSSSLMLLDDIIKMITEKNIPFFIMAGESTNFSLLARLSSFLPVTISGSIVKFIQAQIFPDDVKKEHPIISVTPDKNNSFWETLPPINVAQSSITVKPGSEVLLYAKVNNVLTKIPVLITKNIAGLRTIYLSSNDIWKWKLQGKDSQSIGFDRFIQNSLKWLASAGQKEKFSIRTARKEYSPGETVEFIAELYSETYEPIESGEINVNIKAGSDEYPISLTSLGNGIYSGEFIPKNENDYSYEAIAVAQSGLVEKATGRFIVGGNEIEFYNTTSDYNFLISITRPFKGNVYFSGAVSEYLSRLKALDKKASREYVHTFEWQYYTDYSVLIIIILLFSIEWFIRKREGML